MKARLHTTAFDVPDDWRCQPTYGYTTPDGAGSLVFDIVREHVVPETLFAELRTRYLTVWKPLVVYANDITLKRHDGGGVPGVEGALHSVDGSAGLRFALAALGSRSWTATLMLSLLTRPDFMRIAERVVRSVSFLDDGPRTDTPPAHFRRVYAGGATLDIPDDWTVPDTLEFLDPSSDDVILTVTLAEPMVTPDTIDWERLLPGKIHVLSATESAAPPGQWEARWSIECAAFPARTVVRKAVADDGHGAAVTAYGQAPEVLEPSLDRAWAMLRRSLRLGDSR